jgi:hypothetical protein
MGGVQSVHSPSRGDRRVRRMSDSTLDDAPASSAATTVVMIRRAKYNFKYKRRKGNKPRLNQDDLGAILHMLQGTRVTHTYNPSTNDLCFDTHTVGGDSLFIDGEDTGGQVIRTAIALAIGISGGRSIPLGMLQIHSAEKACMLYVQAAMHTLKPGDSFTVRGGSPHNADAPSFQDYQCIFATLRGLLGLSFELADESEPDSSQLTLCRREDSPPDAEWDQGEGELSIYLLDQVLMALVFVPPGFCVTLRGKYDRDYHVAAMVMMLRLVGHTVVDAVEGASRVIVVGNRRA